MDMSSTGIDISIIIPVYNGKNKISKALNSVLKVSKLPKEKITVG